MGRALHLPYHTLFTQPKNWLHAVALLKERVQERKSKLTGVNIGYSRWGAIIRRAWARDSKLASSIILSPLTPSRLPAFWIPIAPVTTHKHTPALSNTLSCAWIFPKSPPSPSTLFLESQRLSKCSALFANRYNVFHLPQLVRTLPNALSAQSANASTNSRSNLISLNLRYSSRLVPSPSPTHDYQFCFWIHSPRAHNANKLWKYTVTGHLLVLTT